MLRFGNGKCCRFFSVWIIATVSLAVGCRDAKAAAKSRPPRQPTAQIAEEITEAELAVNSACDKILSGDFESAQEIVQKSSVPDSKRLRQLGIVIDKYMAVKARRNAPQNDAYQSQIDKLEKLRQKGLSEDVNDINKVFSVVIRTLEYANEEQKRALLKDPLVRQAIQKVETKAVELESKGQWLDAYTIYYSKLGQIYEDDEAYSEYAKELLDRADIVMSFQDNPCETSKERYAGIKKQMFINTVDVLDSSYVNIIDYRRMAIKGIRRCELLAKVLNHSHFDNSYNIQNSELPAWSDGLARISDKLNQSSENISKDKFIDVFEEVLALNESRHRGGKFPHTLLIAQFAKGALSALDPYTVIYWPSQVRDFEKALTNQFSGIGIKFSKEEGLTKVVSVLPDTPAYSSGLETGDVIKAVDGVETRNMSSNCVVRRITGPEGTEVTLTIRRTAKDESCDVTINRAMISVPSIHGWQRTETGKWLYMIDGRNKIGYVRITGFNSRTARDFEKALGQLEAGGLEGLILDLRSNGGGLLSDAVEIVDKFIEKGLMVRIQPRFGVATYLSAHRERTHPNYPIVVLINRFTASAAEIVAGVLQDPKYNRATLVGERSYGKGSVQLVTNCPGEGAQLRYTTAHYHLPSGRRVENRDTTKKQGREDWGISPDVSVRLRNDELQKIGNVRRANELLAKADYNNAFSKVKRYSSQETIDADPQLAIGLLVLKSKMIQTGYELGLN